MSGRGGSPSIGPADAAIARSRISVGAGARWTFYVCGLALIGFGILAWHAQWTDDFPVFVQAAFAQCAIYALAAWVLLRLPPPSELGAAAPWTTRDHTLLMVIFGVAVILRLIALSTPPNFLSTDVYRYVWDGRVQAAGLNPYRYIPADPVLAPLRDEAIYSHINRVATAPTIYAPFAQMVFFVVTRLGESVTAMRLCMLAFEAAAAVVLGLLLKRLKLPLPRLALYLWHPLPAWEFACGAHVDAVLIATTLAALLAAVSARRGLSAVLLAMATLTKFFPIVLAPAIWRRWDWKAPLAFFVTIAALYAAYLGAGWKVFGYLFGYASEEGIASGAAVFGIALLRRVGVPGSAATVAYAVIAIAIMGALALRAAWRDAEPRATLTDAAALATATTVLIAPHYAWYFAWLVPFIAIVPRPSLVWLTSAAFALYVTDWPLTLAQGLFVYGPFLGLLVVERFRLISPRSR